MKTYQGEENEAQMNGFCCLFYFEKVWLPGNDYVGHIR